MDAGENIESVTHPLIRWTGQVHHQVHFKRSVDQCLRAHPMSMRSIWCALTLFGLHRPVEVPDDPPEANVVQHVLELKVRRKEVVLRKHMGKLVDIGSS